MNGRKEFYFLTHCIFQKSDPGPHPMQKKLGSKVKCPGPGPLARDQKYRNWFTANSLCQLYKCLLLSSRLIHSSKCFCLIQNM